MRPLARRILVCLALAATLAGSPAPSGAYSVLSHEAIIDSVWRPEMREILLERFPATTPAQLREAHAYAYGGSIIQDLGYYPFGNRLFSDLTHYVRSGDFVLALLRDAQNVNEYAFALGALAHYAADDRGHPVAVNRAVPMVYPRLERKYGDAVTFEDDPKAHVMVEFSFDVVRLAASGYVPSTYHDLIGFKVARPLLDRAFQETYGLSMGDLFRDEDLSLGTFRRAASEVVPQLTRIAWKKRRNEILKKDPGVTKSGFVYRLPRRNYEAEWGKAYRKPNFLRWRMRLRRAEPNLIARILVFIFEVLPKVGPLETLAFKVPTPQAEQYFEESYRDTLERYSSLLRQAGRNSLTLPNEDLDTGRLTARGQYRLADRAYATLVDRLAKRRFAGLNPALREDILAFYAQPENARESRKEASRRRKTEKEVQEMKATSLTSVAAHGDEEGTVGAGTPANPATASPTQAWTSTYRSR